MGLMAEAVRRVRVHLVRADEGASAVEMAMSASVLFLMLMGSIKVCQAVYTYHYISEAARDATRYAIVHGSSCATYTNGCTTVDSSALKTYLTGMGYPAISSSAMTVTAKYSAYPTGVLCNPDAYCRNPGNLVTVQVQYAFPVTIPFFGSKTWNMSSTSAMVISE